MLNSIISGGISGAIIVWLFRNWISERIRESIKHEYAQKLEAYKAELNANMQAALYEHQLYQLRTSLFFDHQRLAFASILSQISETERKWAEVGFESETGCWMHEPVPAGEYDKLKKVYSDHQLFLDQDCIFAFKLVLEAMGDSLPVQDGDGTLRHRETQEPYRRLDFLQDRVAVLFQEKIGIRTSPEAKEDLALLGAIRLVNRYHFTDIDIPVKGVLKLEYGDDASDAVVKARNNKDGLILKLKEFKAYLEKEGFFNEALGKVRYCLTLLEKR
jgi:hypothetical protein